MLRNKCLNFSPFLLACFREPVFAMNRNGLVARNIDMVLHCGARSRRSRYVSSRNAPYQSSDFLYWLIYFAGLFQSLTPAHFFQSCLCFQYKAKYLATIDVPLNFYSIRIEH